MSISLRPPPGTTRDPLYPDSDGELMGETEYHVLAITHLYEVLGQWFRRQDNVHVAANMLLYYEKGNPAARRGPDVMVSKDVRGKHPRRSFRIWEEGVAPAVIIELTSLGTKDEDQFEKPGLYARLGVKEYYLFDPEGEYLRPRLQGFRLIAGQYVAMTPDDASRLSSAELALDMVIDGHLLRLIDPATGHAQPTRDEYAEQLKRARRDTRAAKRTAAAAKRGEREALRKELEALHAATAEAQRLVEAERRRADMLEAENARLRSMLPPPGE